MSIFETKRKTFSLVAVALLAAALLCLMPQVMAEFIDIVMNIVDDDPEYLLYNNLPALMEISLTALVVVAFGAFVLINRKTEKHHYIVAAGAGLAAVTFFLYPVFNAVVGLFKMGDFGNYIFEIVNWYLPGKVFPLLVYIAMVAFSFKRWKGAAVPAVMAALIVCLLVETCYGDLQSIFYYVACLVGWGYTKDTVTAVICLITALFRCSFGLTFYVGLLLSLPLAFWEKEVEEEEKEITVVG